MVKKTDKKYSRLIKNSAIFSISNFGSSILRFIIVPFYTYHLSTSEYGTVETLSTTVSLIMPIMVFAMQEAVLRFTLSKNYNDSSVFKTTSVLFIFNSFFFLLGYFPFKYIEFFDGLWWLFYLLLILSAGNNILLNYTRGTGKTLVFMLAGIINTFVMLISNVLTLSVINMGIKGYFISLIMGYLVSSIFIAIYIKPIFLFRNGKFDFKLLKEMLKYSIPLMPTAAMWWIMNVSDRYIITYFMGISFTGIYSISNKIPTIISMFYSIFQQAWQIAAVEEVNSIDRNAFYENVYEVFFRGLFLISSLVILFVKPLLTIILESNYVDAWKYAPVLLVSSIFSSMAGFLGVNYIASGKTMGALKTSILGSITNIILNFIFIPIWGLHGAAIATLIGFYVVWIARATIFNGGLKFEQKYEVIHFLFFLEIIQCIVAAIDFSNGFVIQFFIFIIIMLYNKKMIFKFKKKIYSIIRLNKK